MSSLYALLAGLFAMGIAGAAGGGGGGDSSDGGSGSLSGDGNTGPSPLGASNDGGSAPQGGDVPVASAPVDVPDAPAGDYNIGWAGLSAEEQLIVEQVNRARLDPNDEVSLQGVGFASGVTSTPKEALAVLSTLSNAAEAHSEDMDARNFFAHVNPDGETPTNRAQDAGYNDGGVGENIGWIGSTSTSFNTQARAINHHDNLWASSGHQQNLMDPDWNVIGVGYDYGDHVYQGTNYQGSTFVTELFGETDDVYLTGVVIDDTDGDNFYDIGEGLGDVHVTAFNSGGTYTTSTWGSGGYTLELAPGTYTVVYEGGDLNGTYETQVTIGGQNVKLDVIEDPTASITSASQTSASGPVAELTESFSGDDAGSAERDLYEGEVLEEAGHGDAFLTERETLEAGWREETATTAVAEEDNDDDGGLFAFFEDFFEDIGLLDDDDEDDVEVDLAA